MNRTLFVAVAGLAAVIGGITIAQPAKDAKPAQPTKDTKPAKGEMPTIPGMTADDMKAMEAAATPGPQHRMLAKNIGNWTGKCTMWMTPGAEAMKSECTYNVTDFMEGKFIKTDMAGDMPGMGPMKGMGLFGYDNVAKQFQAVWVVDCGTGMMIGKGEASTDGNTITWTYDYHCAVQKKQCKMKDIERHTSDNSFTIETHATDPASGKEFKMMEIVLTRKAK